jgi:hypothetical protein
MSKAIMVFPSLSLKPTWIKKGAEPCRMAETAREATAPWWRGSQGGSPAKLCRDDRLTTPHSTPMIGPCYEEI